MINKTFASIVGLTVIAGTAFTYMNRYGLEVVAFSDTKAATIEVPDTNGLVEGSRVLLRGIPIGRISSIGPSADSIVVEWKYDQEYDIPVTSGYRIDNLSALGEAYLSVLPSTVSGPYLTDGAEIEAERVQVPTTVQELSARLTRMLEQLEPDRIGEIFRELDIALPDDPWVLGNLDRAGELLASALSDRSESLTKLLETVQPLLLDSAWLPDDLAGAAHGLPELSNQLGVLANGFDLVIGLGLRDGIKYGASPLIDELQHFLDVNAADLQTIGVDLLPSARAGAAALRTIDIGQLLDRALAAADGESGLTLHVRTTGR